MLTNDATQLSRLTPEQAANILRAFEKTRRQDPPTTPAAADDNDRPPAAPAPLGSALQGMEQLNAERTAGTDAPAQFALPDAPRTPDGSGDPDTSGDMDVDSAATPLNATVFAEVCADAMGLPAFRHLLALSRAEMLDLLAHAFDRDEIPDAPQCALFDTVEAQLTAGSPRRKPVVEQVMRHFLMEASSHGYPDAERQAIADRISAIHQRWTHSGDAGAYMAEHRQLVAELRQGLPALEILQQIAARSEFCRLARQLPMLQRLELLTFAFEQVVPEALRPACRQLEEEMGRVAGAHDDTGRAAVSDVLWADFFAILSEGSRIEVGGMMQRFQQQLATDGDRAAYAARVNALVERMAEGVRQEQRSVGTHDLLNAEEFRTLRGRIASLPEAQPAQVVRLLMEAIDRRVQARIDDGDFGADLSQSATKRLHFQILKSNRDFFSAQTAQILQRLAGGPPQGDEPALEGRLDGSQDLLDRLLAAMTAPPEFRLGHDALRQSACDQPQTLEDCRRVLQSSKTWLVTKMALPGARDGSTSAEKLFADLELQTCGLLLTDSSRKAMHAAFLEVAAEFESRQNDANNSVKIYSAWIEEKLRKTPAKVDVSAIEAMGAVVASRAPLALPDYEKAAWRLDSISPSMPIPTYLARLGGLTAIMEAEIAHRNAGLPFDHMAAVQASTHPDVIAARDALLTIFRFWHEG